MFKTESILKFLRTFFFASLSVTFLFSCAHGPDSSTSGRLTDAPRLTLQLYRVPIAVSSLSSTVRHYRNSLGFTLQASNDGTTGYDARFADGSSLQLVQSGRTSENSNGNAPGALEVRIQANDWTLLLETLKRSGARFSESARNREKKIEFDAPSPLERIAFVHSPAKPNVAAVPHKNSAQNLAEVWLVVESLAETETELRSLNLGRVEDAILQPLRAKSLKLILDHGVLIFVQRDHMELEALRHLGLGDSRITGVSVGIRNLEGTDRYLKRSGRARHAIARYNEKSCLIVAPQNAGGVFLEFVKIP